MSAIHSIPRNAATLEQCLNVKFPESLEGMDFYEKKGIQKTVARVAAERFAAKDMTTEGILWEASLLVHNLQKNNALPWCLVYPNIISLPPMQEMAVSRALNLALLGCSSMKVENQNIAEKA